MPNAETILRVEEAAVNAVPPLVMQVVDGWRLRYHHGVTRRGNSVWPNAQNGRLCVEEKVELVETFYRRRSSPARFQICPAAQPTQLPALLTDRGYVKTDSTHVQIAPIRQTVALAGQSLWTTQVEAVASPAWLAAYAEGERVGGESMVWRQAIFDGIGPPAGFAITYVGGEVAAVGLGVAEEEWVGLFNVVTLPNFRRQGAALAMMTALGQWGESLAASRFYLQVRQDNLGAQAFYARLGFATLYDYCYMERSEM